MRGQGLLLGAPADSIAEYGKFKISMTTEIERDA